MVNLLESHDNLRNHWKENNNIMPSYIFSDDFFICCKYEDDLKEVQ